ncbi:MAG: cysteine desulfurase NifS [Bacteroides sp.]|nr:cysteine desulfurase NifS [Eubacterium sp.]MCM1417570.1 cysteine desulfurase NifS [Roseburia sp.]MCM1461719.1 cysteine desulfurase NifS [Bacteroides sp.]
MTETRIYLDNAATTRISDEVLAAMLPWLKEGYGNASSIYALGRKSAIALNRARADCAETLGAQPREIFFTGGGSESDNWAIKSAAALGAKNGKKHLVTSVFEHHAVLNCMKRLEKEGFTVTYLPVYENGIVRPDDLAAAIRPDTALVSIMYANNEIGTIQPIPELGAICRERGVLFHTDAVQAAGNVAIDVKAEKIDLLSLSGHKLHAPKGVGLLYADRRLKLAPLIDGGGQESGRRAGTENIAAIVGLAEALKRAKEGLITKNERLLSYRERIIGELSRIERARLNGDAEKRLAGNVNFSFEGIEGESLLLQLDLAGIAASSGSACTSGSLDPSHVLLALGLTHEVAHGSLRLTMSDETTEAEVDELLRVLPPIVDRLRKMSPLWERISKQ